MMTSYGRASVERVGSRAFIESRFCLGFFAEPGPEPGHVGVPPERRQVLQLPEEADVQPVVPEPGQPVAVQQHGQRRRRLVGRGVRRVAAVRRGGGRPAAGAAPPAAAHDQLGLAAGVHLADRVHARLRRGQQATRPHPGVGHPRQEQEQILPNSVINVLFRFSFFFVFFFFMLPVVFKYNNDIMFTAVIAM